MFSYSQVASFLRMPEFAEAVDEAWKEAKELHDEIKENEGFINLIKQTLSNEKQSVISQEQRTAIGEINLTPHAFFEVLFTCALTMNAGKAMRKLHEDDPQPLTQEAEIVF